MNEIFAMGGYGLYVWASYGLTLLVFSLNVAMMLKEKRQAKKILKKYFSNLSAHES